MPHSLVASLSGKNKKLNKQINKHILTDISKAIKMQYRGNTICMLCKSKGRLLRSQIPISINNLSLCPEQCKIKFQSLGLDKLKNSSQTILGQLNSFSKWLQSPNKSPNSQKLQICKVSKMTHFGPLEPWLTGVSQNAYSSYPAFDLLKLA